MELKSSHYKIYFLLITTAAFMVALVSVLTRSLSPVNETLYTGVAWDMWTQHHYLIPQLNGHVYNQKPPLFFWLLQLGWKIFGVNDWWPIVLPALCSFTSLVFTATIAKKCFKQHPAINILSALILLGMGYWTYYSAQARLDQLFTLCILLSLYGLIRSIHHQANGFLLFGLGNGLALLTKGPLCFLFTATPLILAPYFFKSLAEQRASWFMKSIGALIISIAIVSLWAIPIITHDPHYAKSILWDQTVSRLERSHSVQIKVWYYYFIRLPLLIMPWLLWPALWRGLKASPFKTDEALRWLVYSMLIIFCLLSLVISQKGSRFLIPFMPYCAILFAYFITNTTHHPNPPLLHKIVSILFIVTGMLLFFLTQWLALFKLPIAHLNYYHGSWGILLIIVGLSWWSSDNYTPLNQATLLTLSSCCVILVVYGIIEHMRLPENDMRPIGKLIHELQEKKHLVAFIATYDDRFEFSGRITQPLIHLKNETDATKFALQHPDGYIIQTINKPAPTTRLHPLYQQLYRHKQVVQIWRAKDFPQRI